MDLAGRICGSIKSLKLINFKFSGISEKKNITKLLKTVENLELIFEGKITQDGRETKSLFRNLKNLKYLKTQNLITVLKNPYGFLPKNTIEELRVKGGQKIKYEDLIKKQTELKIIRAEVGHDGFKNPEMIRFYARNLKIIKIDGIINLEFIQNIKNLPQLKELRIMTNPQNISSIRILKELNNNRVEKLIIKVQTQKDLEKLAEMIKSDPQFEWLKFNRKIMYKVQYLTV